MSKFFKLSLLFVKKKVSFLNLIQECHLVKNLRLQRKITLHAIFVTTSSVIYLSVDSFCRLSNFISFYQLESVWIIGNISKTLRWREGKYRIAFLKLATSRVLFIFVADIVKPSSREILPMDSLDRDYSANMHTRDMFDD